MNDKLTVFNGLYAIENGHIYAGSGRKLSLPQDSYNLLYWGTPIYDDPIYSTPEIVNPGLSLDADLSSLYLELRKNYGEETYHPVYDSFTAFDKVSDSGSSIKDFVTMIENDEQGNIWISVENQGVFCPWKTGGIRLFALSGRRREFFAVHSLLGQSGIREGSYGK